LPPFGGPLPPTMQPAPPGAGPAVAPHGNPGQATQGLGEIQIALQALQKALPSVPMGTEMHKSVLDAIKKIGEHMTEMQNSPQMQIQNLLAMIAKAKQGQPGAGLGGMAGAGGGAPGGAPPPPPPMLSPPAPGGAPPGMAG
jgi:hypothetical protein